MGDDFLDAETFQDAADRGNDAVQWQDEEGSIGCFRNDDLAQIIQDVCLSMQESQEEIIDQSIDQIPDQDEQKKTGQVRTVQALSGLTADLPDQEV